MKRNVTHKKSSLHYEVLGSGQRNLLLFHGFGQDSSIFRETTPALTDVYTIYTFDLYFHGQSNWGSEDEPLEKSMWMDIMGLFISSEKINKFSLAGYSLGARFALATLESFPILTEQVFLIAPDGIKDNFWYRLATGTRFVRRIFKGLIKDHRTFETLLKATHALKLINPSLARFAQGQMSTETKRSQVYHSWVVFRLLKFDIDHLSALINRHSIALTIIAGKHDRVIQIGHLKNFLQRLKTYELEIVEAGHYAVLKEALKYLGKKSV